MTRKVESRFGLHVTGNTNQPPSRIFQLLDGIMGLPLVAVLPSE